METQDREEVDRIKIKVEECRKTLQSLGYVDFTFEDFFCGKSTMCILLLYAGCTFIHFIKLF